MSLTSQVAVVAVVVVLAVANVLNNRLLPGGYVVTSIVATAVLLLLLRAAGIGWDRAGLVGRGAVPGVVLVLGVALCYSACLSHPATRELFLDRRAEDIGAGRVAFEVLVRIPLGTVLLEEVAFRGVLYGLVRAEYGVVWATTVSSALFGLWHVLPARGISTVNPSFERFFGTGTAGAAMTVVGAVFVMAVAGVILCEIRRRSGGLIAPAALHWATNGLGLIAAYLVINAR